MWKKSLEVQMHRIPLVFACVAVLLSACTVNQNYQQGVTFDQSASIAIKKAVHDLDLPTQLSNVVSKTDKITIESIDTPTTDDGNIVSTVEDVVISQYVDAGYKVLERDYDMLVRNYLSSGKLSESDVSMKLGEDVPVLLSLDKRSDFDITPADKAVTYRVNEIGIVYTIPSTVSNSGTKTQTGMAIRNSRVILNVRVEDPSTNQILFSKTLDGNYSDEVPMQHASTLQNLHYQFHSYKNPVANPGSQSGVNVLEQTLAQPSRPKSGGSSVIYSVLTLSVLAYLAYLIL